jgi:hypothetical protein
MDLVKINIFNIVSMTMTKSMSVSVNFPGCFVAKQRIVKKLFMPNINTYIECDHATVGKRGLTLDIIDDVRNRAIEICSVMESDCNSRGDDSMFDIYDDGLTLLWRVGYFLYEDEDEEDECFIE